MSILKMEYSKYVINQNKTDERVLNYIEQNKCEYYDDLLQDEKQFGVWYQLSELRTGMLSWYPFKKSDVVLEIGAGFGGLTGLLCDRCGQVVATERADFRAKAMVSRWEKKENLSVYAGEWSEMDFGQKFDYVILTGLLERIGRGSSDLNVYAKYLEQVSAVLKEDGKILFSVENRYGLKYFCGAPEPHTNRAFDGLNQFRQGTGGYSFSKKELEDILAKTELKHHKFYYLLPDYKLPQLVYTDAYLPEKNLDERLIPYYQRNDTLIASEQRLYRDVIDNGVFPFFANSYLLEAGKKDNMGEVVYAAVSTDRGREKSYATSIHAGGEVIKAPVFEEGKGNAKDLYEHIEDLKEHGIPVIEHIMQEDGSLKMQYISHPTLSNYLKNIVEKDAGQVLCIFDKLYEFILQSSEIVEDEENKLYLRMSEEEKESCKGKNFGPVLKKAYMELMQLNCFYDEQNREFFFFDQEYVRENYPAKYVLFRAIHYFYVFTPGAEKHLPKTSVIERYDMTDFWDIYRKEEDRFLQEVRNHKKYRQFYQWAKVDENRIRENAKRLESEEQTVANYKISDKMKKIWKVQLEMLDLVDMICKKYDLTYFFVHGSLLGAVRHQGFIPWDDDIDIAMPRKDYDRFLEIASKELPEHLSIHTASTETEIFFGGLARLRNSQTTAIEAQHLEHSGNQGIWIDILPLDVCTMDEAKLEKKQKAIKHCHRLIQAKMYGKEMKKFWDMNQLQWQGYKLLACFYKQKTLGDKLNDAMRMYTDEESDEVAFFTGYHQHRRLNAADFRDKVLLDFENRKVPAPIGYENYFFMTMGKDYMKYPPVEERKPKHAGIYDPQKPYTEYVKILGGLFKGAKGKKIILFGAGMMFEDYMKKWGGKYRPDFLVDNDENKWERRRQGIEIKAPKEILNVPENKRHLIICSFYYKEIQKQLEEMGIKDYHVYVQHAQWIVEAEAQR